MTSRKLLGRILVLLVLLSVTSAAYGQVTVILTRHAEKAATPPKDPPLSQAGQERAKLLASMLADSGVAAIYTTEFQRTQQTAAVLAERVHVKPTVLPANDTGQLVKAIRARDSGVVVVVAHSNTLPEIIAALGGPTVKIPESEYDNLFVLTIGPSHSSLLRLHYGDSAPVNSGGMQDMMPTPPKR
jgi:broad specificity phosphatase PhoE